jgi:hypothetical protein
VKLSAAIPCAEKVAGSIEGQASIRSRSEAEPRLRIETAQDMDDWMTEEHRIPGWLQGWQTEVNKARPVVRTRARRYPKRMAPGAE